MRHIIGLSSAKEQEPFGSLDSVGRIRFNTDSFHALGYFHLISPSFEYYARRDAGMGITSINVMFRLGCSDIDKALEILSDLESKLASRPKKWHEFLGTVQHPYSTKSQRIEPLLFRSRALSLISTLRNLIIKAKAQRKNVVYGNGVCYRYLCGIKLSPNTLEYS